MEHENLPTAPVPGGPVQFPHRRGGAAAVDFDDEDASSGGGGIGRLLGAIRYYKWLVIAITVVGTVIGVLVSRWAPVAYTAEARLWVAIQDRSSAMEGPIQSGELLQGTAWLELLGSYAVLDPVVRDQQLYLRVRDRDLDAMQGFEVDSVYTPGAYVAQVDAAGRSVELRTGQGDRVEVVRPGEPIGAGLGLRWQPDASVWTPGREIAFAVLHPRLAVQRLVASLDADIARGSNFLMLRYSNADAERAQAVMNTLADRYVDVAAELKRAKLAELRDILETQLTYAENNLRNAELALESFRVQTITLPTDPATPVNPGIEATRAPALSGYFELNIEREALERDRSAIARLLASAPQAPLSVDPLAAIGAVQGSPELSQALTELATRRAEVRALQQQYTDEHPLTRRALDDLAHLQGTVVPQLARAVMSDLETRIANLDGMVSSASEELRQIPARSIDEARLNRAVQIAATLYNELRQRYEGARLATETTIPDIRVLDYARVPQVPSSNPRMQILLVAVLGSLGLAIALALLLERLDPRYRYPEQVTDGLRLRVLGGIPNLKERRWLSGGTDRAEAIEALRGVRLSLTHAYGSAGPLMVTLSSPGPGDGKTFLTANLGLAFADLGRRTLVIDGDTRRGTLHRVLGVDRKPGLTEYLAGRAELGDVIRPTSSEGLDILPCGMGSAAAPELLSSARMGELLAYVRANYHVILIDSPPLGAGIDPLVLATASGHMVLVVRTGKTERAVAEAKLAMLDQLPVRVLGAVVNGLDSDTGYRYYSYLPGYAAESEEPEATHLLEPA